MDRTERLDLAARRARAEGPRIALVSTWDIENNAVRILAAVLRERGHHAVEIYFKDWVSNHLDPATDEELESLVRVLRDERVQLAAISVRASAYHHQAVVLTEAIQAAGIAVMWGGMHPTLVPDDCLEHADLVLRGEAEPALGELADRLANGDDPWGAPNLEGYGPDGELFANPLHPLVQDLDQLPFRDYTTDAHKYLVRGSRVTRGDPMRGDPVFQMMASRGCIYKCSYCYNSTYKRDIYPGQRWYRTRSVGSAIAEVLAAREHWDFRRVRFDDEVFSTRSAWLDEFCERWPREVGVPFEIFLEPKLVTRERLLKLKEAGLVGVFMGVQAAARVSVDLYDREADDEAIEDIARIFHEVGVYPHYQLIWDDPESTDDDLRRVFEMVQQFPRPFDLYMFSLTVFPSSGLDRKLSEQGGISRWDIEGINTRTFYQHRVNLRYPRPVHETFWLSLCVLSANPHVPRPLLDRVARSERLKRHPLPVIGAAHLATYAKMGSTAVKLALRGEMTTTLVRRWLSADRLITS